MLLVLRMIVVEERSNFDGVVKTPHPKSTLIYLTIPGLRFLRIFQLSSLNSAWIDSLFASVMPRSVINPVTRRAGVMSKL